MSELFMFVTMSPGHFPHSGKCLRKLVARNAVRVVHVHEAVLVVVLAIVA